MTDGTFSRRVYLAAPAEEVWEWLVDPDRVWEYHPSALERRPTAPGETVRYLSRLGGHPVVEGVATEVTEGRRLAHTFQLLQDFPEEPSRVTLEILRLGDAMCCLELRHEGLVPGGETWNSISVSWDVVLSSLKTRLETGRPLPWPSRHAR